MNKIIIFGVISLICFIGLSLLTKNSQNKLHIILWWLCFIVVFLISVRAVVNEYKNQKQINSLEKRVNIINSLEIRVNLDEITQKGKQGEKNTSVGIQSVVALFTKDKIRHRFVTDFQFSFQQLSENIRRATFIYIPEEPTKILGRSIDYLKQIEIFSCNYKKFIDPLGFNKNNENHKINLVILLNGIEVISLNNLAITKGQLYSGQLNFNVSDSFKGISVRYQKEIESK